MRKFNITVNGTAYAVEVEEVSGAQASAPYVAPVVAPVAAPVVAPKAAPVVTAAPEPVAKKAAPQGVQGSLIVKSPMPGTILGVSVTAGQAVKKGQVLCILEAMKMENEIMAPRDGVVAGVSVTQGAQVNSGDLLVSLQ